MAAAQAAASAVAGVASPLLAQLTASKVLVGVMGLAVNFGGRFIMTDYLTPMQQEVLRAPAVKRAVIFCMAFLATRDVMVAAGLTLAAVVLLEGLLSERSRFCIVPGASAASAPPWLPGRAAVRAAVGGGRVRHPLRGEPAPPSVVAAFRRHAPA